ncbi:hypothetical protein [Polyangium spumosum]|uniref:Uncharacterized protein n=1 Tax=Polyangium spumosum TaxID=889282 RepID=A0A6N7Q8A6_9BACT|nr:hypothetical protein [Polyangium spumosum]MRG98554.1 hypothetical protein [Polyangium spumosum]
MHELAARLAEDERAPRPPRCSPGQGTAGCGSTCDAGRRVLAAGPRPQRAQRAEEERRLNVHELAARAQRSGIAQRWPAAEDERRLDVHELAARAQRSGIAQRWPAAEEERRLNVHELAARAQRSGIAQRWPAAEEERRLNVHELAARLAEDERARRAPLDDRRAKGPRGAARRATPGGASSARPLAPVQKQQDSDARPLDLGASNRAAPLANRAVCMTGIPSDCIALTLDCAHSRVHEMGLRASCASWIVSASYAKPRQTER